jgi:hypothetical protein
LVAIGQPCPEGLIALPGNRANGPKLRDGAMIDLHEPSAQMLATDSVWGDVEEVAPVEECAVPACSEPAAGGGVKTTR